MRPQQRHGKYGGVCLRLRTKKHSSTALEKKEDVRERIQKMREEQRIAEGMRRKRGRWRGSKISSGVGRGYSLLAS